MIYVLRIQALYGLVLLFLGYVTASEAASAANPLPPTTVEQAASRLNCDVFERNDWLAGEAGIDEAASCSSYDPARDVYHDYDLIEWASRADLEAFLAEYPTVHTRWIGYVVTGDLLIAVDSGDPDQARQIAEDFGGQLRGGN